MSPQSSSHAEEPRMRDEDDYLQDVKDQNHFQSQARKVSLKTICLAIFAAVVIFVVGVVTGRYFPTRNRGLLVPAGDVKVFMKYNRTFSQPPSPETNAAWDALFPTGNGFVQHDTISPQTSGLVVYHSLHCLNALRLVYYASVDGASPHLAAEHEHMADPGHVRHCIDYLRQSLMCAADTNLELVKEGEKGVTGWGYTRTCRDMDSVRAWATENWSQSI